MFCEFGKSILSSTKESVECALRRKRIPEKMIEAVMAWYVKSRIRVKAMEGISKEFKILVGDGSILSPLLFIIVIDKLTKEIRKYYHGN